MTTTNLKIQGIGEVSVEHCGEFVVDAYLSTGEEVNPTLLGTVQDALVDYLAFDGYTPCTEHVSSLNDWEEND